MGGPKGTTTNWYVFGLFVLYAFGTTFFQMVAGVQPTLGALAYLLVDGGTYTLCGLILGVSCLIRGRVLLSFRPLWPFLWTIYHSFVVLMTVGGTGCVAPAIQRLLVLHGCQRGTSYTLWMSTRTHDRLQYWDLGLTVLVICIISVRGVRTRKRQRSAMPTCGCERCST